MVETRLIRESLMLPRPFRAPQDRYEAALAEIWAACLGMDRVGLDDDYHDLGGDSVVAAIIFTQVEARFGLALPISTLVEHPTVASLAALVGSKAVRAQG